MRGDCRKCKVAAHGRVPKNWQSFLRNPSNKTDLFLLLAKSIYSIQTGLAYATIGDSSICNKVVRASIPCIHEEADTRIFVHLKHAVEKDCITTAAIHANDTDIFVLATAFFHQLSEIGLKELWVSFGKGRATAWYPIHEYAKNIGPSKSKVFLFFHALSGCDIVSAFKNKGKKSFFQTWEVFPDITNTFLKLSSYPVDFNKTDEQLVEKFISILYDRSSKSFKVDNTRKKLFSKKKQYI